MSYLKKMVVERVDVLPRTNGRARMFRVGILNFIDSYNFVKISLDKMANFYQGTCFADDIKIKRDILINTSKMKVALVKYYVVYQ